MSTEAVVLHEGDNRVSLRTLPENSIDAVVTDPPYSLTSITKRFGKAGSAPARADKNDGSFARVSGGFMGKCYHPDTEILTIEGWKRVAEVESGQHVATLNPVARALVWQPVVQRHAYDFDGELVRVGHRSAEQLVTPNHEVVLSVDGNHSLAVAEADGLPRKFHLTAQSNPVRGRMDSVSIVSTREYGAAREPRTERAEFDPIPFFYFLGLWLGDGYTVTRSDDHPANDFFGFSVTKARKVVAIRGALTALNIRFTETPKREGGAHFYCYNFALLGFLKALGKAKEKHIPNWLFSWDAVCVEHLYRGLIETDGCRQGKDQEVFFTSSGRLADDFQRLCLHTGRSASSCFKPGGHTVRINGQESVAADAWVLCVLKPGKRLYAEAGTGRGSDVVSRVPYVGKVYCVGVAEHHTLYTRLNGKPVWSGNSWDASGIERDPDFWAEVYRVLKPGGFVFAFAGARTGHWQACAMELAGFIMHPMHAWLYGQGFPKGHDAAKEIDKHLGTLDQREVVDTRYEARRFAPGATVVREGGYRKRDDGEDDATFAATIERGGSPEAQQWDGWKYGTQTQKPAMEPIYLGQKPYDGKPVESILKWGVGAFNVGGCRVGRDLVASSGAINASLRLAEERTDTQVAKPSVSIGRYPANVLHDGSDAVVALFPESAGQLARESSSSSSREDQNVYGAMARGSAGREPRGDSGSAARFFNSFPADDFPWPMAFYHSKAGKADRRAELVDREAGEKPHPTVKPIGLLRHLVRHICPPGGTVLDPFGGTGTTGEAARLEGCNAVLMEAEPEYVAFLRRRFDLPDPLIAMFG